ncbi:hypothetical protein [Xenorhabdus siamensis]|uniref:hypothetical protein n=1 Tax=Xenorhabdus siamensis TaxID=3136254 RepID=UPI0030F3D5F3
MMVAFMVVSTVINILQGNMTGEILMGTNKTHLFAKSILISMASLIITVRNHRAYNDYLKRISGIGQ